MSMARRDPYDQMWQPMDSEAAARAERARRRSLVAFWLLGLLNNASFVIMIASAKSIASGGVGFVYLADTLPGFVLKASAPFWFERVSYARRVLAAGALMSASFALVALGPSPAVQLAGVACASAQTSLGEASMLALTTRFADGGGDAGAAPLTAWSSGTGFAGIFGYAWIVVFHMWCGLSFAATTLLALSLVVLYLWVYFGLLPTAPPQPDGDGVAATAATALDSDKFLERHDDDDDDGVDAAALGASAPRDAARADAAADKREAGDALAGGAPATMGARARLRFLGSLWRVMTPLFVVYLAEYALQSGVWSAIGFPTRSKSARERFYEYANWCYQLGVFVSRSSGTLFTPSVRVLWALPLAQLALLVAFAADALARVWYDFSLLGPCVVVGLLGGAVYVHGFKLVALATPPARRELAMTGACIAADLGLMAGSAAAVVLQACIYQAHGLDDATIRVGFC